MMKLQALKQAVLSDGRNSNSMADSVKGFVKDLSKAPAPKQIAAGAAFGWLAGYLTMKVGKMAATVVGGTLILLQIAHHKGYVKVDWNRMSDDTSGVADRIRDRLRMRSRNGYERFRDVAGQNAYLVGGFTGGFFLGIASS
jgi:FUN14 domain-containing protein 1